jgi:hypothetical protein
MVGDRAGSFAKKRWVDLAAVLAGNAEPICRCGGSIR